MDSKRTKNGSLDGAGNQSPISLPEPPGAARRRLLRAISGSGGAALGVLLASRWHKPIVKSVVLPAHAETSPGEAVGCLITVLVDVDGTVFSTGTDGTIGIFAESGGATTEMGSVLVPDTATQASLIASSVFPPGNYEVNAGVSRPGNSFQFWTVNWSCCDATESQVSSFGSSSDGLSTIADIGDDGECELNSAF